MLLFKFNMFEYYLLVVVLKEEGANAQHAMLWRLVDFRVNCAWLAGWSVCAPFRGDVGGGGTLLSLELFPRRPVIYDRDVLLLQISGSLVKDSVVRCLIDDFWELLTGDDAPYILKGGQGVGEGAERST